ncbi:MAG: caspase family protein [Nitrospinae bacterium]|nr:caspase family protein [Nitrospinota bacterium]
MSKRLNECGGIAILRLLRLRLAMTCKGSRNDKQSNDVIVRSLARSNLTYFLVFLGVVFLASCTATPQIQLKSEGMSMGVKKEVPFLTSNIAYSPDGKSALSGNWDGTVRLWDITSGKLTKEFKGHKGHIVTVAFSPDGKTIATGGNEGTVKLWDVSTGRVIRQFTDYYGSRIMGFPLANMSFSPDGRYIMVPYGSFISDGSNNARLYEVQTGKVIKEFEGLFQDFSPDGKYVLLYQGRRENVGLFMFGSSRLVTVLYLVDFKTGKEIWRIENELFKGAVFSSDNRHILAPRVLDMGQGFTKGIQYTFSLVLLDASTGRKLKEFGRVEAQEPNGLHISLSPDSRYVLTGEGILGFTNVKSIYKLWDIEQDTVKEILDSSSSLCAHEIFNTIPTFSRDGMSAVMNDCSSMKLYNIPSGEELANFIGFENVEWLVTTPNGYYNVSEKGDQYLSVKVGGKDYTIAQLRESFYRPDFVKAELAGGSLKEFKKLSDIKRPPDVTIVDTPKSLDKDEAVVTLKITDVGGGIGDIRLYLNGSAIVLDSSRDLNIVPSKDDKGVYKKYTVKLINGLNTLRAIAFNGDNTMQSTDALFDITASFKSLTRPSLYALIVGINEYKNPKLQLNYAVADAGLFGDTINKVAPGLFEKIVIKRLITKDETEKENIIKELKAAHSLNPDDLFIFYVASHGTVDDGEYFLITSNVGSTSTAKLKTDAIPQNTLKELIANIPTTKKLIVIDTCSAGALGDAIQVAMLTRGMNEDTAMKVLSRAVGSTILSASTSVQQAIEGYQGHGLFTYIIAEGLSGKADTDKDGFVKTTELANYVDDEVPVLAERVFKKAQYPTVSPSGMGFPIGKVK